MESPFTGSRRYYGGWITVSSILHTHKRAIMIVIIVPIGASMLFFGLSGPASNTNVGAEFAEPIATIGDVNITAGEFMQYYNNLAQSRKVGDTTPTPQEMVASGAVDQLVDELIKQGVFRAKASESGMVMERSYLEESLKKDAYFQTNGQYDARKFNIYVENLTRDRVNWDQQYAAINDTVRTQLFGQMVIASVRVLERDLKEQFDQSVAKISARVATIEPKVEQAEEVYQAYYEENKARYMTLQERTAEFVAISIAPPIPEIATEVVTRARAGEDFAALAETHSQGASKINGGDRGWVTESDFMATYEKPLFDLEVGAITDPVQAGSTIRVYKIEEKRTKNPDDTREIHLREIQFTSVIDPSQRQAQQDLAETIAIAAKEENDLRKAVNGLGFEVFTTDSFSTSSTEIEHVDPIDVLAFSRGLSALSEGDISNVIAGTHNLYVARVTSILEPKPQAFEEVRDMIVTTSDATYKRAAPEYQTLLRDYFTKINETAGSLEEIKTLFPELDLQIIEVNDFGRNDIGKLFENGVIMEAPKLFDPLIVSEPGVLVGPIDSFARNFFAELVERTDLDEAAYEEQWTEQEPQLRNTARATLQIERASDYMLHLGEKAIEQGLVKRDTELIMRVLGLDQPETPVPTDATPAPADETPVPTDETL